jgi:hypothetical protein
MSALTMASSTLSTVAVKSALMRRFDTIDTCAVSGAAAAPALAVENAIAMSPEPLPDVAPVRPNPCEAR